MAETHGGSPPDSQLAAELSAALGEHAATLMTPLLVIDLDAAEHNIKAVIRRCGDARRWRPHIKTVKQARLLEALFEAGVVQLKCATPLEAELALRTASRSGVALDLLVAYPHRGPNLERLLCLLREHPAHELRLLANDPDHLTTIDERCAHLDVDVSVYLDVDLGMLRTGSTPEIWAAHAASWAQGFDAVRVEGLHGYDGHHKADDAAEAHRGYAELCELARAMPNPAALELVTSGTHSYAFALADEELAAGPWRHTVSPGTVVLSDGRSECAARDMGLRQAAFVLSRVISGKLHRATLDAGSKAITPDAHGPSCRVLGYPEARPLRASEEHLPVEFGDAATFDQRLLSGLPLPRPALGALVWLVPDHVCTTVNLHRDVAYLAGGRLAGMGQVDAASRRASARPTQSEAP